MRIKPLFVLTLLNLSSVMALGFSSANHAKRFLNDNTVSPSSNSDIALNIFSYPIAAAGTCIEADDADAAKILKRNGISVRGRVSDGEKKALAKGIAQIEKLLGGGIPKKWQTTYNYIETSNSHTWNQAVYAINVRRSSESKVGENVGGLMHEFGHKVGNAGEYSRFKKFLRNQNCNITEYAKEKPNEQFAEAFSAYVTYPDKLKKVCPRAYEYFAQKLFPNTESIVASCGNFDQNAEQRWIASEKKESNSRGEQQVDNRPGIR